MRKQCIECQTEFVGRVDAKYCSSACRSSFHNRTKLDGRDEMKRVNSILRKNRRILAGLNKTGTTRVNRNLLLSEGFNFSYLTNVYVTSTGKTYKYCYDHGYLDTTDDYLTLVIKKEYVR
jgi:hypothetical protein